MAKYLVLLPLFYYYSDSFKFDDIQELSHVASNYLYLSLYYGSFRKKILFSKICLKLFASKICVKLWKCGSIDKLILDKKLNSSIGMILSVGLILSIDLKVVESKMSKNYDFGKLLG